MIMNEDSKNKQEVEALLIKFKIKKIIVSTYHLQINDMIKHEYILIIQALLKFYEN